LHTSEGGEKEGDEKMKPSERKKRKK